MNDGTKKTMLLDVKKILDKHNIVFFPLYGTLLGLYRDKRIIDWDVDIDIGIWKEQYNMLLGTKKDFEEIGYYIKIKDDRMYSFFGIYFDKDDCNSESVDYIPFHASFFYLVRDMDNVLVMRFFDNNILDRFFDVFNLNLVFLRRFFNRLILFINRMYVYPAYMFLNYQFCNVYDTDFVIPADTEKYLSMTYGESWDSPIKNWDKKKHNMYHNAFIRYTVKDKNVRKIWVDRT